MVLMRIIVFSRSPSVMTSGNGQKMPFFSACLRTLDTVLREHGTDKAMFRSLLNNAGTVAHFHRTDGSKPLRLFKIYFFSDKIF